MSGTPSGTSAVRHVALVRLTVRPQAQNVAGTGAVRTVLERVAPRTCDGLL